MINYYNKYLKYKSKYIYLLNGGNSTLKPYNTDYLKVDDTHSLYYEQSGNPDGIPIIYIHGGPGGGLSKKYIQLFDLSKTRVIGYEQRGCGRSSPFGCLENNTTECLIDDLEKLRIHLKIKKWILVGGSWGSTLSLLYAIKNNDKVLGMLISGVCLLRQVDLDWLYKRGGVSNIYPEEWEIFENHIPIEERNDMILAYYKRLTSSDEKIRNDACYKWCQLELKIAKFYSRDTYKKNLNNLKTIIPLARIECHFFINNKKFMKSDNYIIENCHLLKNIPITISQSRYDMVCPVDSSYQLKKKLPHINLKINSFGGHSNFENITLINNYKDLINKLIDSLSFTSHKHT